jgi:hypothetical protein
MEFAPGMRSGEFSYAVLIFLSEITVSPERDAERRQRLAPRRQDNRNRREYRSAA